MFRLPQTTRPRANITAPAKAAPQPPPAPEVKRQELEPSKFVATSYSQDPYTGHRSNITGYTKPGKTETPAEAAARTEREYMMQLEGYDRQVQADMMEEAKRQAEYNRKEYEQAKAEGRERLGRMEEGIDAYEAGYDERWMASTLARESAAGELRMQQAMSAVVQEYAALGRTPSPNVLGYLRRNMAAQLADTLQIRRVQLEQERSQYKMNALQMRHEVYSNVDVQMPDAVQTYALLAQIAGGM